LSLLRHRMLHTPVSNKHRSVWCCTQNPQMSYIIHPTLGHRALVHHVNVEYMRPVSTAVNRLSCPWNRKGPREPGHAPQKIHLQGLRARVANSYAHFVEESVGAPASEAAARCLAAIGTGSVGGLRPRAQPSLAARTDVNYVASEIFSLPGEAPLTAAVHSHSRAPCFCLLTAHCWHVHSSYSTWPLCGWELVVERVQGTRRRLSLLL
jgi:hypothetical protein